MLAVLPNADVAVAALTGSGHAGEVYEVTGPQLLSFADAVEELATASGRELSYLQISHKEFRAGMANSGAPKDVVELTSYLFETVLDGRNSSVTDGVERALGRAPRSFKQYAAETAASGVWQPVHARSTG